MGGVDKWDQYLNYYLVGWKSLRWWKCTFFRLVELAIVTATVIYFHHNPDFKKKRCPHKTLRQMLAHELVQPYLDSKANPDLDTSVTRGKLPSIPSIRLSGKHFPSSNHPVRKSCVVCAYEKNNAGKYKKTKTSNLCEKCNVFVCKNCFEWYHTHSQPKRK